ncbi:MAG: ATP-binding cassette domain-containing protein, partial [Victivallaceae bacterium]
MSNLAINIENASLSLGGNLILKNFNWQLERGRHHFILGANGAGKTTLVKMIMGLAWPYYGAKVEVLGERYGHVDLTTMRKRIAWVSPFLQQLTSERELSGAEVVISGVEGTLGLFRKEEPGEREKALEMLKMLKGEHLMER